MLLVPKHFYVIRWSRIISLGMAACEDAPWYSYISDVHLSVGARGVEDDPDVQKAIRFSSWDEAFDVVAVVCSLDERFDNALEIITIDS